MSAFRPSLAVALFAALALSALPGCLGCSSGVQQAPEARRLQAHFGRHADAVLAAGPGFMELDGALAPRGGDALQLRLTGDSPQVRFAALGISVQELGASGAARRLGQAVTVPRRGGDSFWVANDRGAEEWLRVDHAEEPLRWRVSGGALEVHAGVAYVLDARRQPRLAVRAPAAFFADGSERAPDLTVEGDTLVLRTGGRGEALVDPTWTQVDSLATPRFEHTATLLSDGRVLVVGGELPDGGAVANAELYNPFSNNWADGGTLAKARYGHTATLLLSGEVLVAGGTDGATVLNSAELWEPSINGFADAGHLAVGRQHHTATRLLDGRVLFAGGDTVAGAGANTTTTVELYNPDGGWTTGANMNLGSGTGSGSSHHAAVLLGDGRVLMAGGWTGTSTNPKTAAGIYDPVGDAWHGGATLNTARRDLNLVVLQDGNVMAVGGCDPSGNALTEDKATEVTSVATAANGTLSWSTLPAGSGSSSSPWRCGMETVVLPDGEVLTCGGTANAGSARGDCETYDSTIGWQFVSTANSLGNRALFAMPLLPSGRALAVGGVDPGNTIRSSAWAFDDFDANDGWTQPSNANLPTQGATATPLPDGTILVAGGDDGTSASTASYLVLPDAGVTTTAAMHTARTHATATLLPDGRVLVVAGFGQPPAVASTTAALTSVEAYLPQNGTWQVLASVPGPRGDHTATLMPDGRVLVVGGSSTDTYEDGDQVATTESYDWTTDQWTAGPSLNVARHAHTATLLGDGALLVAGGVATATDAASGMSSERLEAGSWKAPSAMNAARIYASAVMLQGDRVLVLGGGTDVAFNNSAEEYLPRTDSWSPVGNLNNARSSAAAVLLRNGKVLAAGGTNFVSMSGFTPTATAEIFDPYSQTWTSTQSMATGRFLFTLALMPDGRAAALGGGPLELYDEGRGASWSPTLATVDGSTQAALAPGQAARLTGGNLTGFNSGALGNPRDVGSGDTRTAATNFPVTAWERQDNGLVYRVAMSGWDGGAANVTLPASALAGAGWAWVSVSGVPSQRLSVTAKLPQGAPCNAAGQCGTGNCVDGVCCDTACGGGVSSDCQVCSVKAGGAVNGTCGPVTDAGYECRAASAPCQLPAACDGVAITCPNNPLADAGTPCGSGGTCDASGTCQTTTTTTSSGSTGSSTTTSGSSGSTTGTTTTSGTTTSTSGTTTSSTTGSSSSTSTTGSGSTSTSGSGSGSSSSSSGSSSSSSASSGSGSSSGSTTGTTGTATSTSTSGTASVTTGTSGTTGPGSSGSTGGAGTSGTPGAKGPATFALSGCGCDSLMDPGFAGLALLLFGLRRRRR